MDEDHDSFHTAQPFTHPTQISQEQQQQQQNPQEIDLMISNLVESNKRGRPASPASSSSEEVVALASEEEEKLQQAGGEIKKKLVPRDLWAEDKQGNYWKYVELQVNETFDLQAWGKAGSKLKDLIDEGCYVCTIPIYGQGGKVVCGATHGTAGGGSNVMKHITRKHATIAEALKAAGDKEAFPSSASTVYESVTSVLASGLAYTPFCNSQGPLKNGGVVSRNFPSINTFKNTCNEVVQSFILNVDDALRKLPNTLVGIEFDTTPAKYECAILVGHFTDPTSEDKLGKIFSVPLACTQMEGSLTVPQLVKYANQVCQVYDIKLGSQLTEEILEEFQGPIALFGSTDSAANVRAAAIEMLSPTCLRNESFVHKLFVWCPCLGHIGNLLSGDILKRRECVTVFEKCRAVSKAVNKSHILRDLLRSKNIPSFPSFVRVRWSSAHTVLEFIATHGPRLKELQVPGALNSGELQQVVQILAVLSPINAFIKTAQYAPVADGLLMFIAAAKLVQTLNRDTVEMPTVGDVKRTTTMYASQTTLSLLRFTRTRAMERFFSFVDVEDEDENESGSSSDSEDEDAAPVPPSSTTTTNSTRFRHNNIAAFTPTLGLFAFSPFKSPFDLLHAMDIINDRQHAGSREDTELDPIGHVLAVRYIIDSSFRADIQKHEAGSISRSASSTDPTTDALSSLLGGNVASAGNDPIAKARADVTRLQSFSDLKDLFQKWNEKGQPANGEVFNLVEPWLEIANRVEPWLGSVLLRLITAPMRSVKSESDFSVVQHILSKRRTNMGPTVLAAYMVCNRARDFTKQVQQEDAASKKQRQEKKAAATGSKAISTFFAPIARSAPHSADRTSSSSSAAAPEASLEAPASEDLEEDKPVLRRFTTRSGRKTTVVTAEFAATVMTSKLKGSKKKQS